MSAKIKPIGDRVLVKYIEEEEEQSRGGIIIPDSAKEKPQEAEVIALGTGKKDDNGKKQAFEVKVGDRWLDHTVWSLLESEWWTQRDRLRSEGTIA